MKKKVIANFFWDKPQISLFEYCFLKSFLKNNFQVIVYSFEKIKLPPKIKLMDASKILNKKEMNKFIHQGKKGCAAAFADKFRIELMKRGKGWWFDMDVLCLKKASKFQTLEKSDFIAGLETPNYINNAVLRITNKDLIEEILREIKNIGYKIKWGDIGPKLITKIIKKNNYFEKALDKQFFYPIDFKNYNYLLLPRYYEAAKELCKKSFAIHNYNQILNRFGIPKNILPPEGSYLHKKFIEFCPELKNSQSLPEKTAERLLNKKNGFKENLFDLIPSLLRSYK